MLPPQSILRCELEVPHLASTVTQTPLDLLSHPTPFQIFTLSISSNGLSPRKLHSHPCPSQVLALCSLNLVENKCYFPFPSWSAPLLSLILCNLAPTPFPTDSALDLGPRAPAVPETLRYASETPVSACLLYLNSQILRFHYCLGFSPSTANKCPGISFLAQLGVLAPSRAPRCLAPALPLSAVVIGPSADSSPTCIFHPDTRMPLAQILISPLCPRNYPWSDSDTPKICLAQCFAQTTSSPVLGFIKEGAGARASTLPACLEDSLESMQHLDKEEKEEEEVQPGNRSLPGLLQWEWLSPCFVGTEATPVPQEPAVDFSVLSCPKQTWLKLRVHRCPHRGEGPHPDARGPPVIYVGCRGPRGLSARFISSPCNLERGLGIPTGAGLLCL